jgi:phosphohistidine phosphatase SixA
MKMDRDAEPTHAAHAILVRQAEADTSFRGDEFLRPLSAHGRAVAQRAAEAMFGAGHHPGPLLVGPLLAARQTAAIIAAQVHLPDDDIHHVDILYRASMDVMHAQMRILAVAYTLPTLVADNPGITGLARFLASDPNAPEMRPGEWRYLPWRPT